MIQRIILIVVDGAGIGALPDAPIYGDTGADTLGHIIERTHPRIPELYSLGLASLIDPSQADTIIGAYGIMASSSAGGDESSGYWELAGLPIVEPGTKPAGSTVFEQLANAGGTVIAIGPMASAFSGRGITQMIPGDTNAAALQATMGALTNHTCAGKTLIVSHLNDFTTLRTRNRLIAEYGASLEEIDRFLPLLLNAMTDNDLLIITANHGCDPTIGSPTRQTREYVPLLAYGKQCARDVNLGKSATLAEVAQTIADIFGLAPVSSGNSFRSELAMQAKV